MKISNNRMVTKNLVNNYMSMTHTCSHSFREKQYTIPDSLFVYEPCMKSAMSSMTVFPTDDLSRTCHISNTVLAHITGSRSQEASGGNLG